MLQSARSSRRARASGSQRACTRMLPRIHSHRASVTSTAKNASATTHRRHKLNTKAVLRGGRELRSVRASGGPGAPRVALKANHYGRGLAPHFSVDFATLPSPPPAGPRAKELCSALCPCHAQLCAPTYTKRPEVASCTRRRVALPSALPSAASPDTCVQPFKRCAEQRSDFLTYSYAQHLALRTCKVQ